MVKAQCLWDVAIKNELKYSIASKQAQVPKTNISNGKSAMFVGCGYKDELEYK